MKSSLSVLIITKNNEETIGGTLQSVMDFDEIVVVDSNSSDKTINIIQKSKVKSQKYNSKVKIYQKEFEDIGRQRAYGLKNVTEEWVLILDSDEIVSQKLKEEMLKRIHDDKNRFSAYEIPFQNYFLGRQLNYGGENYKMVRLFKKNAIEIKPSMVHNKMIVKSGKIGKLKSKIHHHSYRSIVQFYRKFTDYAIRTAQVKLEAGEKSSLKKIFLYPPHMFWARFIKDQGYKDGMFRIPLDFGFAYMEFLTYFLLFIYNQLLTPEVVFRALKRR
ncbi:glycosyltransferase family 2 protein [Candidatus Roizmanbacteria bacterium]|nr:glycosyltransferase family 2 protein [Candidatus Roizmanbacteria bacterium]